MLNGGPLGAMEKFAEAAYQRFQAMPTDHDWENEGIVIVIESDEFEWPALGTGTYTLTSLPTLYANRRTFPPQFARWCKRHLDDIAPRFNTLAALDSFAKVALDCYITVHKGARSAYEWNEEELLLGPPYSMTDVHRLHYSIGHEPRELQDFFYRQLDTNAVAGPDVQIRARQLLPFYTLNKLNNRMDWSRQPDQFLSTINLATLEPSNFPLHGVRGHWTVRHHRQPCLLTTAKSSLT